MDALRRDWERRRQSFFTGPTPPSRIGAAVCLTVLLAGGWLLLAWPAPNALAGLAMVLGGVALLLLWLVRTIRYRSAEWDYLQGRSRVRIEDCDRSSADGEIWPSRGRRL
jgi:hypothetical protein